MRECKTCGYFVCRCHANPIVPAKSDNERPPKKKSTSPAVIVMPPLTICVLPPYRGHAHSASSKRMSRAGLHARRAGFL